MGMSKNSGLIFYPYFKGISFYAEGEGAC
ncbi:hypothetical protein MED121_13875 [Marinomonas sp. MED121]|nr:hypothetical protein MED121_13875 [Marinomonas sp. MED121]